MAEDCEGKKGWDKAFCMLRRAFTKLTDGSYVLKVVDESVTDGSAKSQIVNSSNVEMGTATNPINTNPAAFDSNIDSISAVPLYLINEYDSTDITDNIMTISEASDNINIENYGNTDFTTTINSKTITIKANRIYDLTFEDSFTTITFSAGAANFQLLAKKRGINDS